MMLDPPVLDVDPFSDEVLTDPYGLFQEMRELAPVVYIPKYNYYAVGRYAEARLVASDYSRFTTEGGIGLSDIRKADAWRPRSPITEVDPPNHTGVRAALQKILSPRVIRQWKDAFDAQAALVVEQALDLREFDGVSKLVENFVLKVFPQVLGIDIPADRLIITGELNFNQLGPNNARLQRALARAEPILEWYALQLQREKMLPDGFGEKIFEAEDRGDFAAGTGALHVRSFFRAGVDTTIAGLGFMLNQLARSAEQYAIAKGDTAKTRNAFEEAIRHESPAQLLFRTTTRDVELSGHSLREDTKVAYYTGAANRDPRKWAAPDNYDVTRSVLGNHMAFGAGAHVCIGQLIARQEAECLLSAIFKRVKGIELTAEPAYRLVNTLRTLDNLPLRITPL